MKLLSMEDALKLERKDVLEITKKYLSASMVATEAILNFDRQYTRAENCLLFDDAGNEYLDFVGGFVFVVR